MGKEAQHNYTQMITTLKDQHADEATSLKQEKKSLEEELKKTRYKVAMHTFISYLQ